MTTYPLLAHRSPDDIVAWLHGRPVTVQRFLADVTQLAGHLPKGGHVFNACTDRYRFAVGLCAALLAGKASLLPPAHTPEMVRQLAAFAPDAFCLHDFPEYDFALPGFRYDVSGPAPDPVDGPPPVPHIPAERVMAYVFTSGSTGLPLPHRKTWGAMVRGARATSARLGMQDGRAWALVGTVPPQHMFGLEATVMLALQGGAALTAAPAFYPADIRAALQAVPRPRALVTSPVHLRTLLQDGAALPTADLVLSATAPLGSVLARQARTLLGAQVAEIYGSTETGAMATRHTADTDLWELMPGIALQRRPARDKDSGGNESATEMWAHGGHVEHAVPLGDAIELVDATHFLLHGRTADLVNIAGKRTSLGYLNHQLTAIDGVEDGAFFIPDGAKTGECQGHVVRLVALVVAPGVPPTRILQALRERIDAAFLPRPLLFVDRLPRNGTGKLPRDVLAPLVAELLARRTRPADHAPGFVIGHDHPAMAGHFPGNPIVPGVVLLDHALLEIGATLGRTLAVTQAGAVKFLSPVRPGERVQVTHQLESGGGNDDAIRFTLRANGRDVASGTLSVRDVTPHKESAPC